MDTRIQIDFNGKLLSAYGRNGTLKQIGLEAIAAPEKIVFFPICTRGVSTSCIMEIPRDTETIDGLIAFLEKQKVKS